MHAVLITFTSAVDIPELEEPFTEYARALGDVPGLVSKTWLVEESTVGGFHLFESASAAEAYLDGPLLASVRANPGFSHFAITHYGVVEPLSAMTNGLGGGRPRVGSDR
jgi:Putative mono-oxygenase ydhR